MDEGTKELLEYLDRLTKLNEGGYNCHKEIAECVLKIREELYLIPIKTEITINGADFATDKDYTVYATENYVKKQIDDSMKTVEVVTRKMFKDLDRMKANRSI